VATPPDRLAAMRRSYELGGLAEDDLAPTWHEQLRRWLDDAQVLEDATAMVLATAAADGMPSARSVLLKGLDERGLTFFTHRDSRKGRELAANPRATVVFPWYRLERQVLVSGTVEELDNATGDAYFASRPRGSQLGALASPQSQVVASRAVLEEARDALAARYPEGTPVPRPPRWGGYRLVPVTAEFWQGREDRLHDRLRFRAQDGAWIVERIAP